MLLQGLRVPWTGLKTEQGHRPLPKLPPLLSLECVPIPGLTEAQEGDRVQGRGHPLLPVPSQSPWVQGQPAADTRGQDVLARGPSLHFYINCLIQRGSALSPPFHSSRLCDRAKASASKKPRSISSLCVQMRLIASGDKPPGVDLIFIYGTRKSLDLCNQVTPPSVPAPQTKFLFFSKVLRHFTSTYPYI